VWHPLGYPLLLLALHPFHSLAVVTAVQHLMGIATAGLVYAVLRQWGLPAWGAVLAASPALFDSRQVVVESAVLPDALYALLLMLGVAALLTRRGPALGRCAFAGLMIGWASITRANGAPEMAAVLAVLLVQRAGWRAVGATAAGFALPVVTYMGLFDLKHGSFALTESDGMFLWSRSMSFANCAVIRPPAALRPLCPSRQPQHPTAPVRAWSVPAWLYSREPAAYLWAPGAWWRHDAHPGFDARNNSLALRFALRAIAAQPADYARTVASGVLLTFLGTDRSLTVRTLHFTQVPDVPRLGYNERRHLYAYARTTSDTHAVQPYAYFTYIYQEPVYFPGLVFGLVLLAGLAGSLRRWRDGGGPAALPWAVAAVGIVVPVAVHEAHYRYVIPVVPVACLAAGLAFARRARLGAAGAAPAVARQAVPGQALPAQTLPGQPASQQPASWLPSAPAG
jgi:hypothetical protein